MLIVIATIAILLTGFILLFMQAGCANYPLLQTLRSCDVCSGATELADRSHLAPTRQRSDLLVKDALKQVGLPLLRRSDEQQLAERAGAYLCAQRLEARQEYWITCIHALRHLSA